jgi:hypothetical protein
MLLYSALYLTPYKPYRHCLKYFSSYMEVTTFCIVCPTKMSRF